MKFLKLIVGLMPAFLLSAAFANPGSAKADSHLNHAAHSTVLDKQPIAPAIDKGSCCKLTSKILPMPVVHRLPPGLTLKVYTEAGYAFLPHREQSLPIQLIVENSSDIPGLEAKAKTQCVVQGGIIGDYFASSAYVRAETLSCFDNETKAPLLNVPVQGYLVSDDHIFGLKAIQVSRRAGSDNPPHFGVELLPGVHTGNLILQDSYPVLRGPDFE